MKTTYKGIELDNFEAKALSEDQVKGLSIYQEKQHGVFFADWEPIADQYDFDYSFTRFVLTDEQAAELIKLANGSNEEQYAAWEKISYSLMFSGYHINHVFYYSID